MKLTPELDSQEAAEASSEKAALSAELKALNQQLLALPAVERIKWASETFGTGLVLSSSFGIQSAVTLHLVTSILPKIPVVLIDTGHLFPETYRFIDELTEKLDLNLKIYRALHSPAWQEARYGKLFEQGLEGIVQYNQINKVEPMQRALQELKATAWIAGLRWQQSESRKELHVTGKQNGRTKILPIIDWTNKQIHDYLKAHDLPYHPLWEQGYVSVGDVHTTRKLEEGMTEEETRFFGLKRECGLHEPGPGDFTI